MAPRNAHIDRVERTGLGGDGASQITFDGTGTNYLGTVNDVAEAAVALDTQLLAATAAAGAVSVQTTKGDLITRSATAPIRLAVGSDGQVLTADAASTGGVKWDDAASGGATVYQGDMTLTDLTSSAGITVAIEARDSEGNGIAEEVTFRVKALLVDSIDTSKIAANGSCDLAADVLDPVCTVNYYEDDGAGSKTGVFYVTTNADGAFQGTFSISGSTGTYLFLCTPVNKPAMPTFDSEPAT